MAPRLNLFVVYVWCTLEKSSYSDTLSLVGDKAICYRHFTFSTFIALPLIPREDWIEHPMFRK